MCSGVKKNGRIIIRNSPMMLSDHSTDTEPTNKAAIIKIVPGIIATNHDGYRNPDKPLQDLQIAVIPGLSITFRSGEIPCLSQWGQRNISLTPQSGCLHRDNRFNPSIHEPDRTAIKLMA